MKVVSDLSDAALNQPTVVSIGNFDGLHQGHTRILRTVVEHSRRLGFCPAILTFDPHPIRVLAPHRAPKLISTLKQKLRLIESTGIELAFVARFDNVFAQISADSFVRQYLLGGLRAKAVCVGANFTFGRGQAGTIETLRQWKGGLELIEVGPVSVRGVVASSSAIRKHVQGGRVSRACRLLGRWFEMEGRIVEGAAIGRRETVPTLNLESENELLPARGVYITRIALDGGPSLDALTNIGTRPTFNGDSQSIETFVLHGSVPAEVSRASIQFLKRIRDERKFDSPGLLREQIVRDVESANRFFRILRAARQPAAGGRV